MTTFNYYGNKLKSFSNEKLASYLTKKTATLEAWHKRLESSISEPEQDEYEAKEQAAAFKMIEEMTQAITELEAEIENRK